MGLINSTMESTARVLKLKIYAAVIGVVVVGVAILFLWWNPLGWSFSLPKLFVAGGVKIENTANVIEKVKKISELVTTCYYEEYVLLSKKNELKEVGLFKKSVDTLYNEIVITVKGTVRAGFDLSKIADDGIKVHGDTIDIKLPAPQILDIISNPSDYTIFEESGKWSHEEIVALQSQGKERTLNNALQHNLLLKANEAGKERVADLFRSFGFSVVNVTTTPIAQ